MHHIGQRLSYDKALCTVRYIGSIQGTSGQWLGVEWDDPSRGKHDGSHKAVKYFSCLSKSPNAASFIRPSRIVDKAESFVSAVRLKYASEVTSSNVPITSGTQIEISGKVVEEVGFDKIRLKLAQLQDLKVIILDGMRISHAQADGDSPIRDVSPMITELDLSRNLLETAEPLVDVCRELIHLRALRVNGNRFHGILEDQSLNYARRAFQGIKELAVEETLLSWPEVCHLASHFSDLSWLCANANQLSALPKVPILTLATTLTTLTLEYNDITFLSQLSSLEELTALHNLHLKGNNISRVRESPDVPIPVFSETITYVDISYNKIDSWRFVDDLPTAFPGLTSLRLAHNPIYDNPDLEHLASAGASSSSASKSGSTTEEAYMYTVARLPLLRSLNFSRITPQDRANAEMFYLSRIARQLASFPPEMEQSVKLLHPRYAALATLHGEPDVVRTEANLNPAFLEARLVHVTFTYAPPPPQPAAALQLHQNAEQIPKSFDVYAVRAVAGRLFGLSPLKVRLVWETGEWDPVGGFDDEVGDSSDEEDAEDVLERGAGGGERSGGGGEGRGGVAVAEGNSAGGKAGRWVKREVELKEGPRLLGFCVDGLEAKIRVEVTS